jgi:hypothetical protein
LLHGVIGARARRRWEPFGATLLLGGSDAPEEQHQEAAEGDDQEQPENAVEIDRLDAAEALEAERAQLLESLGRRFAGQDHRLGRQLGDLLQQHLVLDLEVALDLAEVVAQLLSRQAQGPAGRGSVLAEHAAHAGLDGGHAGAVDVRGVRQHLEHVGEQLGGAAALADLLDHLDDGHGELRLALVRGLGLGEQLHIGVLENPALLVVPVAQEAQQARHLAPVVEGDEADAADVVVGDVDAVFLGRLPVLALLVLGRREAAARQMRGQSDAIGVQVAGAVQPNEHRALDVAEERKLQQAAQRNGGQQRGLILEVVDEAADHGKRMADLGRHFAEGVKGDNQRDVDEQAQEGEQETRGRIGGEAAPVVVAHHGGAHHRPPEHQRGEEDQHLPVGQSLEVGRLQHDRPSAQRPEQIQSGTCLDKVKARLRKSEQLRRGPGILRA